MPAFLRWTDIDRIYDFELAGISRFEHGRFEHGGGRGGIERRARARF